MWSAGGFGYDFSFDTEKTEEAVAAVAGGILAHGVTSFLPTMITSAPAVYRKVCVLRMIYVDVDFL